MTLETQLLVSRLNSSNINILFRKFRFISVLNVILFMRSDILVGIKGRFFILYEFFFFDFFVFSEEEEVVCF